MFNLHNSKFILLFIIFIHFTFVYSFTLFSEDKKPPACQLELSSRNCLSEDNKVNRVIVIGDVHGSGNNLRQVLLNANITNSIEGTCEWKLDSVPTLLVQIGDIVDRGAQATEAWTCLDELQDSAPEGSEVVRILG